MGLVKKLKDILFEEEDDVVEPVKTYEEPKEEPKIIKIETPKSEVFAEEKEEIKEEPKSFRKDNSFQFPDFDEEEFASNMSRQRQNSNVLEYERKKVVEKRTDYGRYEKIETHEYTEKKKFKPSPIISPVYGILNQDYRAEDIVDKTDNASNISIDEVRKKAFEPIEESLDKEEVIDEPVVTFFEDKKNNTDSDDKYKSIDDLLEDASDEIKLEDTLEIPKNNNMDVIEDELEKIDSEGKKSEKNLDDTLDNDLFELIDSMYDERGDE